MKTILERARKVLVPRLDTHGDIVLVKGFLDALLRKFPEIEPTLLVREGYDQLKTLYPPRIRWMTTGADGTRPPDPENVRETRHLLDALARERWDAVLTTMYDRTWLNDTICAGLSGSARVAVGGPTDIPPRLKAAWQDMSLPLEQPHDLFIPVDRWSHEVEKYRILWEALTGENHAPLKPAIRIPDELVSQVSAILSGFGLSKRRYCICAPSGTANVPFKAWPEHAFAEVLSFLEREHALPAILVGIPDEAERLDRVRDLVRTQGGSPSVWIGEPGSLPTAAALAADARLYLGNDTGLMHLAAAVGTDVAAVFGGGTWPRFLARGKSVAVVNELPCFRCDWDCVFLDAPCIRTVQPDDVVKGLRCLLEAEVSSGECRVVQSAVSPETTLAETARSVRGLKRAYQEKESRLRQVLKKKEELHKAVARLSADVGAMTRINRDLQDSISWKVTRPLRFLYGLFRR